MGPRLNLIAAACENMGIGIKGRLPWKLKSEMAYFTKMTSQTNDPSKKNAVIMGRKTWQSIPLKYRPLEDRLNVVLSSSKIEVDDGVLLCTSLEEAMIKLQQPPLGETIETIWVIGGSSVYKESLSLPECHRIYLTDIKALYECDTFFPEILPPFKLLQDPDIPQGEQEENGVKYEFKVYEKEDVKN